MAVPKDMLVANDDFTETTVRIGALYRATASAAGVVFVPVEGVEAQPARERARIYAEALIEIRRVVRQFGEL